MAIELRQAYGGQIALEVVRGNKCVTFIHNDGQAVCLKRWDDRTFEAEYGRVFPTDVSEVDDPARRYARCYLSKPYIEFEEGARRLLLDIMGLSVAERENCEFVTVLDKSEHTVVGHYCDGDDAALVAKHHGGELMLLRDAAQLKAFSADVLTAFWKNLSEGKAAPKDQSKLRKGIFDMATKADKKPVKPSVKVEQSTKERAKKTDGPVAKIHAHLTSKADAIKSGKLTRADANKELEALGCVKGTIGVQVGKWCKASGINFVKPPKAEKPAKAPKQAPAPKVTASKTPVEAKKSAKKK